MKKTNNIYFVLISVLLMTGCSNVEPTVMNSAVTIDNTNIVLLCFLNISIILFYYYDIKNIIFLQY